MLRLSLSPAAAGGATVLLAVVFLPTAFTHVRGHRGRDLQGRRDP
jgi:hypothetical protein